MKKYISIILSTLCVLMIAGCGKTANVEPENPNQGQNYFNAIVLDVNDDVILAACTECESGAVSVGSEVSISTNTISSEEVPILNVGDTIRVVYIGEVMETDPLKLQEVISIFWIDENGDVVTEPVETSDAEVENPDWGITLTAENVTPTGATIKCEQAGGSPTGELQTGSDYVLEKLVDGEYEKVEYFLNEEEFAWTAEAWMIPMNSACEWEVHWEWLYGELPPGEYRIGKGIMDFRGSGNYDTAMYYAEFVIE